MQVRASIILLAGCLILGACARWAPSDRPGPVTFDRACPLRRAPEVATFGEAGVRGTYHFAIQGAPDAAVSAFARASQTRGFGVADVMVNMNGVDTMFIWGRGALHNQRAVDREFREVCRLGAGRIYLTHVRHNPSGSPSQTRVR